MQTGRASSRSGLAGLVLVTFALVLAGCRAGDVERGSGPVAGWPEYGGDAGGQRFSVADEIRPENVGRLRAVWTYHTGDVSDGKGEVASTTAFELTPILDGGILYGCSPFNRIFALDPETGQERWTYDPKVDLDGRYANQLICRGVAAWRDSQSAPASGPGGSAAACSRRIFTATNDARLIAVDASTGRPCGDFGRAGEVDLNRGVGEQEWRGEYQVTSPPVIIGDAVVVGSAVGDNQRTDAPSGVVRAFDARTGALRWAWDLRPPGFEATDANTSNAGYALGTPNVWAPMSVDSQRDLVFIPTGNPAPDYYRGDSNSDHYGSSVVALRGSTGEVVWSFQTVHRDRWDYDVPAQPTLTEIEHGGRRIPVLIQATKMGLLFILDRETGEPVFEIEERPVPQNGAPGEMLSPTQPFPSRPPPLIPHRIRAEDAWGITPLDRSACREALESLRFDGIYTPPTLEGALMYPGNAGGSNWGGVAVDPSRSILIANTMDLAWAVRLFPGENFEQERAARPGAEIAPQRGTPFGLHRWPVLSPLGIPCIPPPWGTLAAVDLVQGTIRWQVPLGTVRDIAPIPLPIRLGVPNLGGPLVTASGLIFIGAAMDDYLRAFSLETGEELWKGRLPAGGQATPMTYRLAEDAPQFVVIAAGGHARAGTRLGDALVAFALD